MGVECPSCEQKKNTISTLDRRHQHRGGTRRSAPHYLSTVDSPRVDSEVASVTIGNLKNVTRHKLQRIVGTLFLIALGAPLGQTQTPPYMRGFADLHAHQFSNLAFGGKAFVGEAFREDDRMNLALPWCDYIRDGRCRPTEPPLCGILGLAPCCSSVHGPGGVRDLLGQAVRGSILPGHLVGGYPQFDGWPRWDSFSHQMMYVDWLRRAWEGGLRLMVMHAVNNEWACCKLERAPGRSCDDMEALRLQIDAAKRLERHVDDLSGGPGCGWYRIVDSAQEARSVISAGKLAVVLGAEVDSLFNCKLPNPPDVARCASPPVACTESYVRDQLGALYDMGVRHVFPIHLNTNQFGGAALFNVLSTPRCLSRQPITGICLIGNVRDCYDEGYRYVHPLYRSSAPPPGGRSFRATCNAEGLTDLGKFLIREMMQKKMIIDIDHMSALSIRDTLDIAERSHYAGLVSGHAGYFDIAQPSDARKHESNRTREEIRRIRALGGMLAAIVIQGDLDQTNYPESGVPHRCGGTSETFAQAYLYASQSGPVAFGSDFNGFAGLPGPRSGRERCPGGPSLVPPIDSRPELFLPSERVQYPFRAATTGLMLSESVIGQRSFNFNTDGLAHVGMLPDMIADLSNQFGSRPELLEPLLTSAEAYVKMWEQVDSTPSSIYVDAVAGSSCGYGTIERPFSTLMNALNAVREEGSIFIKPGFYPESLNTSKRVTLLKWPGTYGTVVIGP